MSITMVITALSLTLALGCGQVHDVDNDGDGFGLSIDCDDEDPAVHPEATEPPCNDGVDQNCDGIDSDGLAICNPIRDDEDGDGILAPSDCDDTDASIFPGADDYCGDGVDQDCDGADGVAETCIDEDGDGFAADVDCNDTDPTIHPGAPETPCPDGIDSDCDGEDNWGACNGMLDIEDIVLGEFDETRLV